MVLVCHDKQFIFMKTRKTASTSVEMYFERFCLPEGEVTGREAVTQTISDRGIVGSRTRGCRDDDVWYNHMDARRVHDLLGTPIWDSYFKFTTLRNPYTKLLSSYLYHSRIGYPETEAELQTMKVAFERYLKGNWFGWRRRWTNDRDVVLIDGRFQMNGVIRMEHMHQDMAAVCGRLGVNWDADMLPHKKNTGGRKKFGVKEFYNRRTEAIIRREYGWVFDIVDYELPE